MFIKGIKYYIALEVVSGFVIMIIMLNFTSSLDFVDIIFNPSMELKFRLKIIITRLLTISSGISSYYSNFMGNI